MTLQKQSSKLQAALLRQRERLAVPFTANPVILFIPFGLMCLLLIYVSLETSPRIYSNAKPLLLNHKEESPTFTLHYTIAPAPEGLRIVSNNGDIFSLNGQQDDKGLDLFTNSLKSSIRSTINDVALANRMDEQTSFVVLTLDERLTYAHVRPVIYALASAGITRYGFEGRILKD